MATVAARGLGPVGGQKLRLKAEAGHVFFDSRGGGDFFDHLVHIPFGVLLFGLRSQLETRWDRSRRAGRAFAEYAG
jgi:hypothetical protein